MGAQLDALLVKLASGGTPWKRAVDLATTANITLSGLQTIDGQTTVEGRRVLVKDQTAPAQNGVYIARSATWTRAEDMDRDSYAQLGTLVRVMRGSANGGKLFYISAPTSGDIRIGSTSTTWSEWAGGGGSGTVTPDPDELVLRDGTGQAYATAFLGPAAAPASLTSQSGQRAEVVGAANVEVVATTGTASLSANAGGATVSAIGATSDVTLDAGRDIIVDVGSASDEIAIKAGGVTKATITPGSGTTTLSSTQGVAVTSSTNITITGSTAAVQSSAGVGALVTASGADVTIGDGDEPAALTITPNGAGGTTTIAGFQPLSLSAAGAMTVQPAQSTSGAGPDLTIGGGAGQTPGTHAPGDVRIDLGTRVGNTGGRVEFIDDGTLLGTINAGPNFANYMTLSHERTNSGLIVSASSTGSVVATIASAGVQFTATAANSYASFLASVRNTLNPSGVQFEAFRPGSATIASATTTSVVTLATVAGRVYQCIGFMTVSNDTDDEGAAYMVHAAFKRVSGTVTQIGSTEDVVTPKEDAGQTGLAAVLDFSGTDIRLRLTTDAADTVNVNGVLLVYERVLA